MSKSAGKHLILDNPAISGMVQLLEAHYLQMVKVNFSEFTYEILWSGDRVCVGGVHSFRLDSMCHAMQNIVHPDDIARLSVYFDLNMLISTLRDNHRLKVKYRQKYNDSYRWIELEMIADKDDYSIVTAYYKNIDADYAKDYARHQHMEQLAVKDELTGFNNRHMFTWLLDHFTPGPTGVMYLDLNGLKQLNDTQGHAAGDNYIKHFCSLLTQVFRQDDCYRIGGDEFVVIVRDILKENFYVKVNAFDKLNASSQLGYPVSAIGTYWSDDNVQDALIMIEKAEIEMYANKNDIHSKIGGTRAEL